MMRILLQVFLSWHFSLRDTQAVEETCKAVSYGGHFSAQDYVKDFGTTNLKFKDLNVGSVQQCFSSCASECRCVAYQLKDSLCELLYEDRETASNGFKVRPGYKYFELKQQFMPTENSAACGCRNGCCRSSPCLNQGTCVELCDDVKRKFKCVCPTGVQGNLCQRVSSCPNIIRHNKKAINGAYSIYNSTGARMVVYCDFTSERGMVWTLVESFALANNDIFRNSPFTSNNPQNEKNFNWNLFRLSLYGINHVKSDSTHWRATCNFNTDGLKYRDYIRAKLTSADIMTWSKSSDECILFERISVRGHGCQQCTGFFKQTSSRHGFVDSYYSSKKGCQFDASDGALPGPCGEICYGEDNFGKYIVQNPAHACSASSSSTTQWWMGVEMNN